MKKFLTVFYLIFIFTCITAFASEDKFIDSLKNCSGYKDSDTVTVNGLNVKSTKSVQGWINNKCIYTETITLNGTNITTACKFTRPQIDEITSVADAYYLTLKYTNSKPDASSTEDLKNNPLAQVLSKYLQDSSVCSMSGF